jgi:hypothetical protein
MRITMLLLSLSLTGAAARIPGRKAEPGASMLAGAVNAVSSGAIRVDSGGRILGFLVDAHTELNGARSPLKAGDDVVIRYQKTNAGIRMARTIWAKPSHVAGVITVVADTSFEILASPRTRHPNGYQKEHTRVRFDTGTVFLDSVAGDLEPGRHADIIGVRSSNGDFLAARVIIYEGDCPVRTPGGAILYRVRAGSGRGTGPDGPSPCSSGAGSL